MDKPALRIDNLRYTPEFKKLKEVLEMKSASDQLTLSYRAYKRLCENFEEFELFLPGYSDDEKEKMIKELLNFYSDFIFPSIEDLTSFSSKEFTISPRIRGTLVIATTIILLSILTAEGRAVLTSLFDEEHRVDDYALLVHNFITVTLEPTQTPLQIFYPLPEDFTIASNFISWGRGDTFLIAENVIQEAHFKENYIDYLFSHIVFIPTKSRAMDLFPGYTYKAALSELKSKLSPSEYSLKFEYDGANNTKFIIVEDLNENPIILLEFIRDEVHSNEQRDYTLYGVNILDSENNDWEAHHNYKFRFWAPYEKLEDGFSRVVFHYKRRISE